MLYAAKSSVLTGPVAGCASMVSNRFTGLDAGAETHGCLCAQGNGVGVPSYTSNRNSRCRGVASQIGRRARYGCDKPDRLASVARERVMALGERGPACSDAIADAPQARLQRRRIGMVRSVVLLICSCAVRGGRYASDWLASCFGARRLPSSGRPVSRASRTLLHPGERTRTKTRPADPMQTARLRTIRGVLAQRILVRARDLLVRVLARENRPLPRLPTRATQRHLLVRALALRRVAEVLARPLRRPGALPARTLRP